ncbi:MAG TPA: HPr family phosphocarrier protein [Chthoniobacteraceae bacterium]|jgi:phosphotransferase system HPr (HPr) family protein
MGSAVVTRQARAAIYLPAPMRREVEIVNELGLHARPAAEFVRAAQAFRSEVTIRRGEQHFSGGSILEVLGANLDFGDRVILEAIGPDAEEALDRLEALLQNLRIQEQNGFR